MMSLLGSKRISATAYHPSSNGLVEQFHHQLKASPKAHANPSHWSDNLPMALLGIRTEVKDDLHCTATELVYGTTLRLLGEIFSSTGLTTTPDRDNYVDKLKGVYGTTLRLPGEFFSSTGLTATPDRDNYVDKLKGVNTAATGFTRLNTASAKNVYQQRSSDQHTCLCIMKLYTTCFNHHTMDLIACSEVS